MRPRGAAPWPVFSFMVAMSAATTRPPEPKGRQDGQFVVYDAVPLFDEHTGEDGVVYDQRVLRCIAANCNRRIETTGDWCPLVLGHTSGPDEPRREPKVIGFAGPFYVDRFRNNEGRTVWAIYCTCWVFPQDVEDFRRNPRRSVEVWPEERPEQRYFDPIALLGAETPRRDLGLIYRKPRTVTVRRTAALLPQGVRANAGALMYSRHASAAPLRYEAAMPGAGNAFLPSTTGARKRPDKYQELDPMADNADLVNQIIAALLPILDQKLDERIGGMQPPGGDALGAPPLAPSPDAGLTPDAGLGAPPDALGGANTPDPLAAPGAMPPPPAGPGLAGPPGGSMPPPVDPMGAGGAPPMADPVAAGFAADPTAGGDVPPPAGPDAGPKPDDEKDKNKAFFRKFQKYAKANDEAGAKSFMGTLDDDEKADLQRYMQGAEDGEKQMYAKCGGSMEAGEMGGGEAAQKYQKAVRSRDEWREKYAKAAADHATAVRDRDTYKQRYEKAAQEKAVADKVAWDWERKAAIDQLYYSGVVIERDDEMANTASFNRDQFKKHIETAATKYQRAPLHHIPVDAAEPPLAIASKDSAGISERAKTVCLKHANDERPLQYAKVMKKLQATNGKATDAELSESCR